MQLEYPDGSSWMDRRVDKQIATREGDRKVRALILLCSSSFLYSSLLTRTVSLKIRGYPFLNSGQIKSVMSGVLE